MACEWPHKETREYWTEKLKEIKGDKQQKARFQTLKNSQQWLKLTDTQYSNFKASLNAQLLKYCTGERKEVNKPLSNEELDILLPVAPANEMEAD